MATNLEKPDFKKQFRGMVHGAQSLTVAYIGVVNGLFAAYCRASYRKTASHFSGRTLGQQISLRIARTGDPAS